MPPELLPLQDVRGPSEATLRMLARKYPPPASWFEEDIDPFESE